MAFFDVSTVVGVVVLAVLGFVVAAGIVSAWLDKKSDKERYTSGRGVPLRRYDDQN